MTYLADNLKFLREQKKLDYIQFQQLTGILTPVDQLEKDAVNASPFELLKLADTLNYPLDRLLRENLSLTAERQARFELKLLALDVDGVLTDGGMYYSQNGDELKKFNTKDGMALIKLAEAGYQTAFLSSGINDQIMRARAERLKVQRVYVGTWKKVEVLSKWIEELQITADQVAYIGDDINDLEVMKMVGLSACPADAVGKIKQLADIILQTKGGEGCVREFAEILMPGL